jgi:ATP-binding protein involved in chromosome partitioning
MGVPFLGEVPLDPEVRIGGDTGVSVALRSPDDPHAAAFYALARNTLARIAETGAPRGPSIEVAD